MVDVYARLDKIIDDLVDLQNQVDSATEPTPVPVPFPTPTPTPDPEPTPSSGVLRHILSTTSSPDLFWDMRVIPGFSATLVKNEPCYMRVYGHIDVKNRKLIRPTIGAAIQVILDGKIVSGSTTGDNITYDRHYWPAQVHAFKELVEPGAHTIEVHGRSYSSAAPGRDGLAEVKGGYNQVVVEFVPI